MLTRKQREGYFCTFTIPVEWWSGTDTIQTERTRAQRRAWVRSYSKAQWRLLKKSGQAWRVGRFIALIGVAYPRMDDVVPSRAAETVKPIIDGGTDVKLWEDDDSKHRCSTIYFQMPEPAPENHYRLTVMIIPVPDRNPMFQIAGGLGAEMAKLWYRTGSLPDGWGGYSVCFCIPHRIWITSNLTDSDIKARQHGARKARTWGRGDSFGVRTQVEKALIGYAAQQWSFQSWWRLNRPFIVLAGVGYPCGVDSADPDNCAESVNAVMKAGVKAGAWKHTGSSLCKAVGFFRLPAPAMNGTHDIQLLVFPVPEGFQLAAAVAQAAVDGWATAAAEDGGLRLF